MEVRIAILCVFALLAMASTATEPAAPLVVPLNVQAVLKSTCTGCHGEKKQKGHVRFDKTADLSGKAVLELLGKVQEQLFLRQMPPDGDEPMSSEARKLLEDWSRESLRQLGGVDIADKLRYPDRGNWVDHQKLFSGEIKDKPFSPARRWLASPQIYMERVCDVFKLNPNDRKNARNNFAGISNPFLLPERSGVRYYDLDLLDGGHFFAMRSNAEWISGKQIHAARIKAGEFKADAFENPKDRWFPKVSQPAFEAIILKNTPPADAELTAAIQTQFDNVLQRPATDSELKNYLEFSRSAISLAGNTEGLRQMLSAVLLESEFVYRLEFGAAAPDEYGRKKLSPREASYAIAYALGDRNPDATLVQVARQNQLNTKADYEREVKRLLADDNAFKGQVDPTLSLNNSYVSSHPMIVRFFRDFFGYPMAPRVFKDVNRSNGFYRNAERGTSGTGGDLVNEADMLVDWYLKQDKNVFENLLGGEDYFVAPVENAKARIVGLNEVYEHFKDANRKFNPNDKKPEPWLSQEDLTFIRKRLNWNSSERDLSIAMVHVEKFRQKRLEPNPVWSYAFGTNLMKWTNAYNVDAFDWQYACEQPARLPSRKGILSHPAWLIAHSQNSATDPVRRGKWVREKLLAGHVPDVPITVDAQIPEHPDKSLRERLDMVSSKQECWKCHQHMNPLGLTFEAFDDFGRYRTAESLESPENIIEKAKTKYGADKYKTKPLDTSGSLSGTANSQLDGNVKDALDLISRLEKSERVRQSIIRHAFRFFMGRNELLSDSQTLIDADKAYAGSGGSFKAVIVSLLTSDSFMYRK